MAIVTKTPGVYREEISLFPPSVAAVETAVPAFVGHTQYAQDKTGDLGFKATKIDSIAEYREKFGEGPEVEVEAVHLQLDNSVSKVKLKSKYYLYDSLRLFFDNGGGKCFIASTGGYDDDVSADNLKKGLEAVAIEDQPTMLVIPDAIALASKEIYKVQQAALKQCGDLKDRFAILDLLEFKDGSEMDLDESVEDFRNEIGTSNLKYGAAYVPHLTANLSKTVTFRSIRGKLKRQGVQLEASNLMPASQQSTVDNLNTAIDDVDKLTLAVKTYVNANAGVNNDVKTIAQVFKAAHDEFQSKVALMLAVNPPAAQTNKTIAAFRELLELTYRLVQATVDKPAVPDASNTLDVSDNRKFARDQITDILLSHISRLNSMTVNASTHIGGATTINRLYTNFAVTATQWGVIYGNAHPDLVAADLRTVYPQDTTGLVGDDIIRRARAQNMTQAAKSVASIFELVRESASAILANAQENERKGNEALRDAAPQIKNVLDSVVNADAVIPPSGVMAGIYSRVDGNRGVHKAPANVSLNSISELTTIISHKDQEDLNVDSVAGKSINAIRPFLGRGKLVWGARTLDGNSNEWRFISVRRFFNMVEESTRNASERFVFEPNDRNTWVKVRGMIENFLLIQWRNGALQGAVPEDAFFVNVGLGETMTALDILEGRMIVELGMAVVRPAEFIILRFSHKMPVS